MVREGEEWLQEVRDGYEKDPYFAEVLRVLRGRQGGGGCGGERRSRKEIGARAPVRFTFPTTTCSQEVKPDIEVPVEPRPISWWG